MDQVAAKLAARQHGLVTRTQLVKRGASTSMVKRRLNSGLWVAVHDGVYRMPGAPQTPLQEVAAVCLALRARASHRCAALVLGLPGVGMKLEVTVAHQRQVQLKGVQVHRATSLDESIWSTGTTFRPRRLPGR